MSRIRKFAFRWAASLGTSGIAMIPYIPILSAVLLIAALIILSIGLFDRFIFSKNIHLALRRAGIFDEFRQYFNQETVYVRITDGCMLSRPYSKEATKLFFGIANNNSGFQLHHPTLIVKFAGNPQPSVIAGDGWNEESKNIYYLHRFPVDIGSYPINVSSLDVIYGAEGLYDVECEIHGDELAKPIPIKFKMRLYREQVQLMTSFTQIITNVGASAGSAWYPPINRT